MSSNEGHQGNLNFFIFFYKKILHAQKAQKAQRLNKAKAQKEQKSQKA